MEGYKKYKIIGSRLSLLFDTKEVLYIFLCIKFYNLQFINVFNEQVNVPKP